MDDMPMVERRKNPARKKRVDLVYQIVWNASRKTYDVLRAGQSNGSFARDKDTAIGLAIREAQAEAQNGVKVQVCSVANGSQQTEWTS
jgi:hypothetical protein